MESKTKKIYVLSLDGGGSRGVATVKLLAHLERQLGKPLHEVFDVVAGTSVGSIIAAGICILKLNATQLEELFSHDNIKKIFNKSIWDRMLDLAQNVPKYSDSGKKELFDKYFGNKLLTDTDKLLVIPAYDMISRQIYWYNSKRDNVRVADIVNSASAAPAYFPHTTYTEGPLKNQSPIDGGLINNNPTMAAVAYSKKYLNASISDLYVVSIGTGLNNKPMENTNNWGGLQWIGSGYLIEAAMDQSPTHKEAKYLLDNYIRVNSPLKKETMLDDSSDETFAELLELGDSWWAEHGEKLTTFINLKK